MISLKKGMGLCALCMLLGCGSVAPKPISLGGKKIDLSAFKLQTLDGSGKTLEISADLLSNGYQQALFYPDSLDASLVFKVPSDGGKTKNTHYPRTELRQIGHQADWAIDDPALHYMHVKMKVLQVAEKKPQTIIGQIHGSIDVSEMLKLRWTGYQPGQGIVEARFKANDREKKEFGVVLAQGLSLGDMIDFTITMKSGVVSVTVNGKTASQTYTPEFFGTLDHYYFKTGNYLQYNEQPPVIGVNKLYELSLDVPAS